METISRKLRDCIAQHEEQFNHQVMIAREAMNRAYDHSKDNNGFTCEALERVREHVVKAIAAHERMEVLLEFEQIVAALEK